MGGWGGHIKLESEIFRASDLRQAGKRERTAASESLASCWFQPGESGITLRVSPASVRQSMPRTDAWHRGTRTSDRHDRARTADHTQKVLPLLTIRILLQSSARLPECGLQVGNLREQVDRCKLPSEGRSTGSLSFMCDPNPKCRCCCVLLQPPLHAALPGSGLRRLKRTGRPCLCLQAREASLARLMVAP